MNKDFTTPDHREPVGPQQSYCSRCAGITVSLDLSVCIDERILQFLRRGILVFLIFGRLVVVGASLM